MKKEGNIFEAKKEAYKPSEQGKTDQKAMDDQVRAMSAIVEDPGFPEGPKEGRRPEAVSEG